MRWLMLVVSLLLVSPGARAADPAPIAARYGMVVTAQHLASDVGADILRRGGNAVDAAVAVGYALAVVYPEAGNIGGGGFMTLRLADGPTTFLDFREKAPLAATATMFQDAAGQVIPGISLSSWLSVGVPGTVAGLEAARLRYGTMSRAALMQPAIHLAADGFVLTPGDLDVIARIAARLRRDPAAAAIFLRDGTAPEAGERLRQPDLARTLQLISTNGPDALYHGPIGDAIVAASRAGGGILAKADFARYAVREMRPVACDYRGYHVISAPPPSSGGVALCEMLGIVQGYDLRGLGFHSAAEVHVLVEAMRRAFKDRNDRLGDPDFVDNHLAELLDPARITALRGTIDAERATDSASLLSAEPEHEGADTTQFSIVDAAGNAVSVTYTLNEWFGSGHVAAGTGIVMNDEMDDFTAKRGVANLFDLLQGDANGIAPGKTPLSSMAPTIVTKDGRLVLVIGSAGGPRIITAILEAMVNLIDHDMTVQEAIDAPRVHQQFLPDTVYLERFALSPDTQRLLEQRGYRFAEGRLWGMAEAILTGAPSLPSPNPGAASAPGAGAGAAELLFGASDVRGGSGKASGLNCPPAACQHVP
jgi:gamma-glutamyltranspeptidase/glutathione hydrolase